MTRDEAVALLGAGLAAARRARDEMCPEEAAAAAWVPGGLSVEVLAERIRWDRARAAGRVRQGGIRKAPGGGRGAFV